MFRTMANQAGTVLENARLVEQLREAADIDQLTGVHNHRYLQERLAQEIARVRRSRSPLGLLMIDLDGFKAVNDSHGHAAGDRVLRSVSSRLLLTVRETDVVARYGGDEFVVLMPDTSPAASREVAHRVAKALGGRGYELGDGTIAAVTASVGLATSPEDGRSPKALLDVADQRMYGVKRGDGSERAGRSRAMSPQTLRGI